MKGSTVALGVINDRRAAARIVDGQLEDFLIDPAADVPLPGAIYRAVVDRQFKGQGGIMLRLPGGKAFLRQGKGLSPGQPMLVQVTGFAEDGKATPVTAKVLFKSRYAIITPNAPGFNVSRSIKDDDLREELLAIAHDTIDPDFGLIIRSEAAQAHPDAVAEDMAETYALAKQVMADAEGTKPELMLDGPDAHLLAWRDWPQPDDLADGEDAFDIHEVETLLHPFHTPAVKLDGGAHMFVEPTRALVAVDVNTGGDTSPAAALKANLATAQELPRQLRIRGLAGQITIDFAPMPKKDRRTLEQSLRAAFKKDSVETSLVGWTPMGNYELQRKRERLPLGAL